MMECFDGTHDGMRADGTTSATSAHAIGRRRARSMWPKPSRTTQQERMSIACGAPFEEGWWCQRLTGEESSGCWVRRCSTKSPCRPRLGPDEAITNSQHSRHSGSRGTCNALPSLAERLGSTWQVPGTTSSLMPQTFSEQGTKEGSRLNSSASSDGHDDDWQTGNKWFAKLLLSNGDHGTSVRAPTMSATQHGQWGTNRTRSKVAPLREHTGGQCGRTVTVARHWA